MADDLILSAYGLGKKFAASLRHDLRYGLRDVAREFRLRPGPEPGLAVGEFWALRNVRFEVRRGEAVAVVGRNGSGKTTLLKLIHGLLKPDVGEIRLNGRAEAIIELGTGLSPLLTGRENISLAAALHGLDRAAEHRLVDAVVDFVELGEFIDSPVQSFSSGMRARLAFGISAHLEPDLLLVDEALAVGDIGFQRKCLSHMRRYLTDGGALLFVSHNSVQIHAVCRLGLMLDQGRQLFFGDADRAVALMLDAQLAAPAAAPRLPRRSGPVTIETLEARHPGGDEVRSGAPLRVAVRYRCDHPRQVYCSVSVWMIDPPVWLACEASPPVAAVAGPGEFVATMPNLPLVPGRYALGATISEAITDDLLAQFGPLEPPVHFEVRAAASRDDNLRRSLGHVVRIETSWS